jgi:hypothetical protein
MENNSGWNCAILENIGGDVLQILKRIARHKHCDSTLLLSVSLGFGMLFVYSTMG